MERNCVNKSPSRNGEKSAELSNFELKRFFFLYSHVSTTASFKDHLVGEDFVANYLLYWLNRNEEFDYVAALGLSQPTDNIHEILLHIASQRNCFHKIRLSDGKFGVNLAKWKFS